MTTTLGVRDIVDDRFVIERVAATGGMGTRMLEKDPAKRPPTARAVWEAIEQIVPSAVAPRRASIRPRVRLFVGDGAEGSATTDAYAL